MRPPPAQPEGPCTNRRGGGVAICTAEGAHVRAHRAPEREDATRPEARKKSSTCSEEVEFRWTTALGSGVGREARSPKKLGKLRLSRQVTFPPGRALRVSGRPHPTSCRVTQCWVKLGLEHDARRRRFPVRLEHGGWPASLLKIHPRTAPAASGAHRKSAIVAWKRPAASRALLWALTVVGTRGDHR